MTVPPILRLPDGSPTMFSRRYGLGGPGGQDSDRGQMRSHSQSDVHKEERPREFTTDLLKPSADSSVGRRKVQPAFRIKSYEQPVETGSTQPRLSDIEAQQQSEDRHFGSIPVEPLAGFPKKATVEPFPSFLIPPFPPKSKWRVSQTQGCRQSRCAPSLRQILF